MGVALRCRHPGMAKHLLHDADVYALLDQQCGRGVPGVVDCASWILASRTWAWRSITFRVRQSSVRSIGPPRRVANTKSWSVHELEVHQGCRRRVRCLPKTGWATLRLWE